MFISVSSKLLCVNVTGIKASVMKKKESVEPLGFSSPLDGTLNKTINFFTAAVICFALFVCLFFYKEVSLNHILE